MRSFKRTKGFRQEVIPGALGEDSFFDEQVQTVLERWHSVPPGSIPGSDRTALLAFPIGAYYATRPLADPTLEIQDYWCTKFFEFYRHDRQFLADLLAALTRYHLLPRSEWRLSRIVAEACCETTIADPNADEWADWNWRLMSWPEVAKHIKRVYRLDYTADRLRSKEFHEEKRRRLKLIDHWQAHFDAYKQQAPPK
jgi:hypothetical protein